MIFTRDKSFYKTLIMLAIPIALQNLVTFGVNLADNVMVGALGDDAVSGLYMGNQIQTLLQVFSGGIEGAILILASQYWGKRDTSSIRKIVSVGLGFSVIAGVLLTVICAIFPREIISLFTGDEKTILFGSQYLGIVCFSYLFFCLTQSLIAAMRSVETARIGLYVSVCSLILNVVLNSLLIYGNLGFPKMGVAGAALATLISRIAETAIIAVYVFVCDKKLMFRLRDAVVFDRSLLGDFIKYGMPIIAGQLVWAANMLASSAIMGRQSAEGAVTAMSIAGTVNNLAYVTMNGMSGAVGIITGKTIGAGRKNKMREYAKTVQVIFLCLGILTGLAVFLIKEPFISLYAVSDAASAEAAKYINVLSVTLIGTCYQAACLFGLVKSGGDISFVFKNDFIFVFLVVLPSAVAATLLGAPAWVVFACLKCDQILKCFVALVKINSFNWMKNLTKTVLESPRLILRPWNTDDAGALYTYASDPDVGYPAGWPAHTDIQNSRDIIRDVLSSPEVYAVCLRDNRTPVGCITLKMGSDTAMTDREDECELGYWLAKPYWGKGIIPEAAERLLEHAFSDLSMRAVWCGYYDGNEKSLRVQKKLGFTYRLTKEGVAVPLLNEIRTEHITLLTKEDWKRRGMSDFNT